MQSLTEISCIIHSSLLHYSWFVSAQRRRKSSIFLVDIVKSEEKTQQKEERFWRMKERGGKLKASELL